MKGEEEFVALELIGILINETFFKYSGKLTFKVSFENLKEEFFFESPTKSSFKFYFKLSSKEKPFFKISFESSPTFLIKSPFKPSFNSSSKSPFKVSSFLSS